MTNNSIKIERTTENLANVGNTPSQQQLEATTGTVQSVDRYHPLYLHSNDDLSSGKVKEIGKEEEDLYILVYKHPNEVNLAAKVCAQATVSPSTTDISLWHQRFGHVSPYVLNKLLPNRVIMRYIKCS
ncbi:uncharacterized protein LOC132067028 [Lycium ferocissimum]|uniref:uncharacterized protein LOC132067028 n=1 Tax=Lycium ferocissimum TaxID=112874 RepID=UPI0028166601|nr:uncharacterized protein LOC132067028 [Lycium ferocissimum]